MSTINPAKEFVEDPELEDFYRSLFLTNDMAIYPLPLLLWAAQTPECNHPQGALTWLEMDNGELAICNMQLIVDPTITEPEELAIPVFVCSKYGREDWENSEFKNLHMNKPWPHSILECGESSNKKCTESGDDLDTITIGSIIPSGSSEWLATFSPQISEPQYSLLLVGLASVGPNHNQALLSVNN